jgi:hypothetical protein
MSCELVEVECLSFSSWQLMRCSVGPNDLCLGTDTVFGHSAAGNYRTVV